MDVRRHDRERTFHDQWAQGVEKLPDPIQVNEACTSPELRLINQVISPLNGKQVLDIGCGLGEASVYFSTQGAGVTAVDLSPGMLEATQALAQANKVQVRTVLGTAENLGLGVNERFDVIYAGNVFHHANLQETMDQILPFLKADGVLVSWDPVAYNPLINIYRNLAQEVRSADEHPLSISDVRLIRSRFQKSEVKFFWFTTLLIFVLMFLVQRRNPNRVRYWKAVVEESTRWAWLYNPLARVDRIILRVFPPLGWLCWNVVIIGRKPQLHRG